MTRNQKAMVLIVGLGLVSFNCASHLKSMPVLKNSKWDDTINRGWPEGFSVVQVTSSFDRTLQPAFFYASQGSEKRPLLVSLHTWSGSYQQEDPLAAKAKAGDWNYIHPDFRGPNRSREACQSPQALADIDDAIQYALDHGSVDPNAIFVVGVSGGGYAVLGTYMKTRHKVRAFLSWAPLSDVLAWYWQSTRRQNKYSKDILQCLSDQGILDEKEALARSPLHWDMPAQPRGLLEIYAGLNDGYSGSIPISHSILFFNKLARHLGPADAVVKPQEMVDLLSRGAPLHSNPVMIEGRDVVFSRKANRVSLTIFDGGHEMLVEHCYARLQEMAGQAYESIVEAKRQQPPAIDITTGWEIPSEGYCDQPYVVKMADGTWLCTLTTGKGQEGNTGQHVVSCTSSDRGKTWTPLVDIEPASGPEASWVMPFVTAYGRVYVFYTYNAANIREIIADDDYARKRVDTLGEYALKYSDDGGRTWSQQRWHIPVRATAIDRNNPYQGRVRFFWGVGKPIRHKGAMYLGFAKVGKFGQGFIAESESWFLRCSNIDSERDPAKLVWQTLPEGEEGLKSPEGPIAEEVNLTSLSDGRLFCTYRTVAGHPCHAYSDDDGKTWSAPAFMTYGPGGTFIDHPRAANFARKLTEGPYAGRFIYWFHNHGGKTYEGRNPAYLLGGVETDGSSGRVIRWGKPVAILYDENPKVRFSYPDFIWDDGLYITETQKAIARVHRIPDELLQSLWKETSSAGPEAQVLPK